MTISLSFTSQSLAQSQAPSQSLAQAKPKTPLRTRPKAVLFDFDGVLVASEPIHFLAWKQLLEELGLPYNPSFIQKHVGKTAPIILAATLDHYRPGWNPEELDVVALAGRKSDYFLPIAQTQLQTYPGVQEGLTWLKAEGIAAAVVSNARRKELENSLKRLGLFDFFEVVYSRDDLPRPKPDPDSYLTAAAALGLEAEECIVLEDSPPGLEAALLGKIPAAAVTTSFTENLLRTPIPGRPDLKPVWIGPSIEAFFQWLQSCA